MDYNKSNKITLALYGLLLRGTIADLINVLSLNSLEPLINIIAIFLFIIGFSVLIIQEFKFILLSGLIFSFAWIISTILHPENLEYVKDNSIQFFIYVLPFLWLGYFFIKEGFFLELFLPVARVKLIIALFVQIIIFLLPSRDIFEGDYQTTAYSIIGGLISVYYLAVKNKKKIDVILSVIGTVILFLCGSRSIFVAILFYWLVYFIKQTSKSTKLALIAISLILFISVSFQQIFDPIAQMANSFGSSTHLVEALQSGTLFEDRAREELYTGFITLISISPWGYGIMGDRYISYQTGLFWKPIYPHNLFLEIMVDFGYIAGSIISIMLLYYIIKSIFYNVNYRYSMTVLLLTSISFIKLLFASTFWHDQFFFMLLGVLIAQRYISKKSRTYS